MEWTVNDNQDNGKDMKENQEQGKNNEGISRTCEEQ